VTGSEESKPGSGSGDPRLQQVSFGTSLLLPLANKQLRLQPRMAFWRGPTKPSRGRGGKGCLDGAAPLGCGLRERHARQQHERGFPSGERGCSGTRDGRYRPGAGRGAGGRHAQSAYGENCSLRLVAGPPLPSQRRRRSGPHPPRGFPLPVPEVSSEPVCLALSLRMKQKGPILSR